MKQFAVAAFIVLLLLLLVRLPSLRRPAGRPAWLATFFGCLAIVSIGAVFPLSAVDAILGGTNLINLVQSALTISAFWFFRDAVSLFYQRDKLPSKWILVAALLATAAPFPFIVDRGATSDTFMADHVDQLANVIYNSVYMLVVAAIVIDLIRLLRHRTDALQAIFFFGLFPIPAGCASEITYVVTAYALPGWSGAQLFADAFYPLFYVGVSVVALAWTATLIRERGTVDSLLWKWRSARVAYMFRHSIRAALRAFRSRTPGELAYALSIQIRNYELHAQSPLTPRQERAVLKLESRFLGLGGGGSRTTTP